MPKAQPISTKISNIFCDLTNETLSSDNNVLYCNAYDKSISITQQFQVIFKILKLKMYVKYFI